MNAETRNHLVRRDSVLILLWLAGSCFAACWTEGVAGFWGWLLGASGAVIALGAIRSVSRAEAS